MNTHYKMLKEQAGSATSYGSVRAVLEWLDNNCMIAPAWTMDVLDFEDVAHAHREGRIGHDELAGALGVNLVEQEGDEANRESLARIIRDNEDSTFILAGKLLELGWSRRKRRWGYRDLEDAIINDPDLNSRHPDAVRPIGATALVWLDDHPESHPDSFIPRGEFLALADAHASAKSQDESETFARNLGLNLVRSDATPPDQEILIQEISNLSGHRSLTPEDLAAALDARGWRSA